MKTDYMKRLKAELQEVEASKTDIDDIISDYEQLYDDALSRGKTDEEVYQFLGDPRQVANDLRDTLKVKHQKNVKDKIVGVMPFISLIIFMLMGFIYDMWNPGWMAFLLIPLVAIILHTNARNAIVAIMPFVSVIAFLILGFYYNLWNPGWMVFLLIPMIAIILNTRFKDMIVALSPFVSLIVFFILGFYYGLWNPGWLVFMIIPMLGILHKKNILQMFLLEVSFLIAIGFYLYMGYAQNNWTIGGLGFILPVALAILFGDLVFEFSFPSGKDKEKVIILLTTIALSIGVFLALGFLLNGWVYAWQVFLLIPVASILLFDKFRFTSISPFVAVVLFFSIGYFFDAFQLSWLAFLIIPMAGVIENA